MGFTTRNGCIGICASLFFIEYSSKISLENLHDESLTNVIQLTQAILHQLGDLKKNKYYAEGEYYKPTPKRFCYENGSYTEKVLYGEQMYDKRGDWRMSSFPIEFKATFLDVKSWANRGFLDEISKMFNVKEGEDKKTFGYPCSHLLFNNHPTWNKELMDYYRKKEEEEMETAWTMRF